MEIVNKDDLFCNKYKAVILCEYSRELDLLKRLIEIADEAVEKQEIINTWTYEGICHLFAKSIVDYSKMVYDNMLLGHFDAAYMVIRAMIENNVCLDIILNDEKEELWKYYLVQSYKNTVIRVDKDTRTKDIVFLEDMYREFDIDEDFISRRGDKKPYIDTRYGWTYKINKNFNFAGLCSLVNKREYDDYKMMSGYSHGTSLYHKISGSLSMDNIMNMISSLYIGVYRLVTMYCWDSIDSEFDEITDEIEYIVYEYINKWENVFDA